MIDGRWTQQYTYELIMDKLEPRLNKLGEFTTAEAVEYVGTKYAYFTVQPIVLMALRGMVEQGKAIKLTKGRWRIIKPNKSVKNEPRNTKNSN